MKKILFLTLLIINMFFISCEGGRLDSLPPPSIYNVKFSPSTVKVDDVITITYTLERNELSDWVADMSVDTNGILRYIGSDEDMIREYKDRNCNDFTELGIKVENSNIVERKKIYPTKYISFYWGEIKCYVPNSAISGRIDLRFGEGAGDSLSDKDLIVIDESGDDIW